MAGGSHLILTFHFGRDTHQYLFLMFCFSPTHTCTHALVRKLIISHFATVYLRNEEK